MTPGPLQIILIIAVVVLLFGANRLPRIMGDFAKGIRSFKAGLSESPSHEVSAQTTEYKQDTSKSDDHTSSSQGSPSSSR